MTASLGRALLFLYAETPVHAGGATGLGGLDLPLQREVTRGLPIIKGESLNGALREHFKPLVDWDLWVAMFGAEPPKSGTAAGSLRPGSLRVHEAQLLAFPAPALAGSFAWVTSPLARARLDRRAHLAGITFIPGAPKADDSAEPDDPGCLMADTRTRGGRKPRTAQVVLGPYALTAVGDAELKAWAAALSEIALPDGPEHQFFRAKLTRDFYLASDELLQAIARECAPIVSRVQLGAEDAQGSPTKTVKHGPFYSEYLPAETLLVAILESDQPGHLDTLTSLLDGKITQVGGDETIGKGLMWCRIVRPGDTPGEPVTAGEVVAGARP